MDEPADTFWRWYDVRAVLRRIAPYCFALHVFLFTASAALWGWSWVRMEGFWAFGGPPKEELTWFVMSNVGRLEVSRHGSNRTTKVEWFNDYIRKNLIESGTRARWVPELQVHRYQLPAQWLPAGSAPVVVVGGWTLAIPLYLPPLICGVIAAAIWGWRRQRALRPGHGHGFLTCTKWHDEGRGPAPPGVSHLP